VLPPSSQPHYMAQQPRKLQILSS